MCLMCDGWSAEEVRQHIDNLIERHGWAIPYVESPNPRKIFGYTVGLTKIGAPEFLVRGLNMDDTVEMLNSLASAVAHRHERFAHGHTSDWCNGRTLYFSHMHGATNFALDAYSRYGSAVSVLEVHFLEQKVPELSSAMKLRGPSASIGLGRGNHLN